MTILEQVTQMTNQGLPREEIVKKLQDQGIAPKAINDAFSQTEIKAAVSNEQNYDNYEISPPKQQQFSQGPVRTQEVSNDDMYEPQAPQEEDYSPQGEFSQYQEEGSYSSGTDTNTIIEVSEQVFSEKIENIAKQVDDFSEFKSLAEAKLDSLSERVKRIELIIDNLQLSILEKVGSYGNNLENVKKEMSMMQNSFSKMVNPIARHHRTSHARKPVKKRTRKK